MIQRPKPSSCIRYRVERIVERLLIRIRLLDQQIDSIDADLERVLPESHPQIALLITIPGIGLVLARIIYTEIIDINYFKQHPRYLTSYSGLAPMTDESAGRKGSEKLNRYCNYFLKYAFIEAAHNASGHPDYRRKYELDRKKHGKIIAKLNLARRIVKSVYWMLNSLAG